jgi:GNAT superfamily N-acetyltransferase
MNKVPVRSANNDDIPALRFIWNEVFGMIGEDSFFNHLFNPKLCVIAESATTPAAMGFLIETGEIITNREPIPCAMIYAVATLREHRGKGFGTAIVQKLIRTARELGYPAIVLCPSDDELFEYYSKRTELHDWFYVNQKIIGSTAIGKSPPPLDRISAGEYKNHREKLLEGSIYVKQDIRLLEYQAMLCDELGGGLFKSGDSCAVVELQPDGVVWIKELLISNGNIDDFVTAVAYNFPASEYIVRTPAQRGKGQRFGMIAVSNGSYGDISKISHMPWYGLAFD